MLRRQDHWCVNLLCFLCALGLMAAAGCGGDSGSNAPVAGSGDPIAGSPSSGVAVDPYIEGAAFQEVDAFGALRQPESTLSDSQGMFHFPLPLQPGSVVEMKTSARGVHAGAPFQGLLRRVVREGEGEPLVVSPLTTLIANGVSAEELLEALSAVGLAGVRPEDLTADPMAGLTDRVGPVTDAELQLLQANMAVQGLLSLTGNPDLGPEALGRPDTALLLEDLMVAVRATLNPSVCAQWAADAGERGEHPFTLGDAIHAAARLQRDVVASFREKLGEGGLPPAPGVMDEALAVIMEGAGAVARSVHEARTGQASEPPAPDPTDPTDPSVPVDAAALYGESCSACHSAGAEDPNGFAPDLAGAGDLVAPKLQAGHQGVSLSAAEVEALAAWLDLLAPPAEPGPADPPPTTGSCTACHGQPPSGTSFPNTRGAHAAHANLPTVGGDCSVCHLGAAHNGSVELELPLQFDARSGPATDNLDGTCSNISCHGGQRTPDWWTGTIAVETQCRSCHQAGTSQYNGYSSGRHTLHVQNRGYDCTECHSTARLQGVHFAGLDTPETEGVAASTLGGAGTRVTGYDPSTRNCTTSCHSSERW